MSTIREVWERWMPRGRFFRVLLPILWAAIPFSSLRVGGCVSPIATVVLWLVIGALLARWRARTDVWMLVSVLVTALSFVIDALAMSGTRAPRRDAAPWGPLLEAARVGLRGATIAALVQAMIAGPVYGAASGRAARFRRKRIQAAHSEAASTSVGTNTTKTM